MKLGTVAGVQLRLNILFLLLLILYAGLGLLKEVLIIIASVLVHEIAHTVMAAILKVKVVEIELMPFGGQAKIDDFVGLEPEQEIYVALTGPLLSLSVAAIFYFLSPQPYSQEVKLFITFNIFLGCFNLVPALPLDGGRIVKALLSTRIGYRKATLSIAGAGKLIALGMIAAGMYLTWKQNNAINYIIMGIFLLWAANRESKLLSYSFMRQLIHKKDELSREGMLPSQQFVAQGQTLVKKVLNSTRPTFYILVVVVDENQEIKEILTETEMIECLLEKGPRAILADVRNQHW